MCVRPPFGYVDITHTNIHTGRVVGADCDGRRLPPSYAIRVRRSLGHRLAATGDFAELVFGRWRRRVGRCVRRDISV